MAPRKSKSKPEVEEVPDFTTGWMKSKMSEAAVQELEDMKLLQSRAVIQWRGAEGEDHPYEGTLETIIFRDFVQCGLAVPVSEFLQALPRFCRARFCNTRFTKGHKPSNHICARIKSHVYTI